MQFVKYFSLPSDRMILFYNFYCFKDLAIIDYSTVGHGVTNLGEIPYLVKEEKYRDIYSLALNENDIALGSFKKLEDVVKEVIEKEKVDDILVLPSAFSEVLGIDVKAFAMSLSLKYQKNIFSVPSKLKNSFYDGEINFYNSLKRFITTSNVKSNSFNIIGDTYSDFNLLKHDYLIKRISKKYNLVLNKDILKVKSIKELGVLSKASLNICTSESSKSLCEYMKEKIHIDYIDGRGELVSLINLKIKEKADDIVIYSNIDDLILFKKYFEKKHIDNITYILNHPYNGEFDYIETNDFVERFKNSNSLILSFNDIKDYFSNFISINSFNSEFDSKIDLFEWKMVFSELMKFKIVLLVIRLIQPNCCKKVQLIQKRLWMLY